MTLSVRSVRFCALVLCLLPIVHGLKHQARDNGFDEHHDSAYNIRTETGREKRALANAAKIGIAALKTLLKDAKKVPTRIKNSKRYVKEGNLDTAQRDFMFFRPERSDVMEFSYPRGKVLVRHVGDRQLTLLTGGDKHSKGNPVLEVIGKGHIDARIYYKIPKEK